MAASTDKATFKDGSFFGLLGSLIRLTSSFYPQIRAGLRGSILLMRPFLISGLHMPISTFPIPGAEGRTLTEASGKPGFLSKQWANPSRRAHTLNGTKGIGARVVERTLVTEVGVTVTKVGPPPTPRVRVTRPWNAEPPATSQAT